MWIWIRHVPKATLKVPLIYLSHCSATLESCIQLHFLIFTKLWFLVVHFFVKAVIHINMNFLQWELGRKMTLLFSSEAWILSILPASLFIIALFSFSRKDARFSRQSTRQCEKSVNPLTPLKAENTLIIFEWHKIWKSMSHILSLKIGV